MRGHNVRSGSARSARRLAFAAAVACVAVVGLLVSLKGSPERIPPKPASAIAANLRTCLIAEANDPDAARTWAGVEQAAASIGTVNAQQTAIPHSAMASSDEVLTYAASLRQQHCALIIAVGDQLHEAVANDAASSRSIAYIYISRTPVQLTTVVNMTPGQATSQHIAAAVQDEIASLRRK
jgi:hypothetical protein